MLEYEELRLRGWKLEPRRYLLLASGPAIGAQVTALDRDPRSYAQEFESLLEEEFGAARAHRGATTRRLRDLGREIFHILFPSPLDKCFVDSINRASVLDRGLRVRFELPPDLAEIPVESMYTPADSPIQALALRQRLSIVRTARRVSGEELQEARLPAATSKSRPFSLVVVVSEPRDGEEEAGMSLGGSQEVDDLKEATKKVSPRGGLALHTLGLPGEKRATRVNLTETLDGLDSMPCALLVIAHGGFDQHRGQGVIFLETANGKRDPVRTEEFKNIVGARNNLRLVVLNLCWGTIGEPAEPFSALAQAIVGVGVPAVVAMKAEVSDAAAARLSPTLFAQVVLNRTIDEAMARARLEMRPDVGIEFATPTLFLHEQCRHGWLFKAQAVRGGPRALDRDPLRYGQALMALAQPQEGDPTADHLARAARYARWTVTRHDNTGSDVPWSTVKEFAESARLGLPDDDTLSWLVQEAEVELAVRACPALRGYALDSEFSEREMQSLPGDVRSCVERERELRALFRTATNHEEHQNWQSALDSYAALEQEDPKYRAEDRKVGERYCEAGLAFARSADWRRVDEAYGCILEGRPGGYRDARERRSYARGRQAEESETPDWPEAVRGYAGAGVVGSDVAGRLAYAQGREAEEAAKGDPARWLDAVQGYRAAEGFGRPVGHHRVMAEGRAAELDAERSDEWAPVVAAYEPGQDDAAIGLRLCHARSRLAASANDWKGVLAALSGVVEGEPEIVEWRQKAYSHLIAQARNEAGEKRWVGVEDLLELVPGDIEDTAALRAYARGRMEEQRCRWGPAERAFGSAGRYQDAPHRRQSARASQHEEKGEWDKAVVQLERLAKYRVDQSLGVERRLRYARGRLAEKKSDWSGVIDTFTPFENAPPDVACRLAIARAQFEVTHGNWQGAIDAVTTEDTGACGKDAEEMAAVVTLVCRLCEGRLAEEQEDWVAAESAYSHLASLDADAVHRVRYAQGRQAEDLGDWGAAVAAYRELPIDRHDLRWRSQYVTARLAEESGSWGAAVSAYEAVATAVRTAGDDAGDEPAYDLKEIPTRTAYARARWAEVRQEWDLMAQEAQLLDYRDSLEMVAYAEGRIAERGEEWQSALEAYRRCPNRAALRVDYVVARQLEDVGDWSAALQIMAPLLPTVEEIEARYWRLVRLRELLPWADGLVGSRLVSDPVAWADPTFPYRALTSVGITPRSSAQEVKDGSYLLMERRGVTPDAWPAWQAVRFPAERLKVDAFLYPLNGTRELTAALRRLQPDAPADALLEDLCRSDPTDEPLLRLLAGDRDQALAMWEARWRADPTDAAVAHSMACAHYWRVAQHEGDGAWDQVEEPWRHAIANWALVLTDEDFWEEWRAGRAECFQEAVTHTDVSRLRRNLSQRLADALAASAGSAAEEDDGARSLVYEALALELEVELEGARAVKEVGGLALPTGDTRLAVGPLAVQQAGLARRLAEFVRQLEARQSDPSSTDYPGFSPTSTLTLRRLRLLFSELAGPATLMDHGEPERALRVLPAIEGRTLANLPADCEGPSASGDPTGHVDTCEFCTSMSQRNPAYLLLGRRQARLFQDSVEIATGAHLMVAQSELASGRDRIDFAIDRWRTAIGLAEAAGSQVRAKQSIVRVVLGRLDALHDVQGRRRGDRLDEAVDLVDRALPIVGAVERTQLLAKAASVLTSRGIWRGYGCIEFDVAPDYEKAAADLRRALELNPDSLHTRDNLARAVVFRAAAMDEPAATDRRLALLAEGFTILHDGLRRAGPHRQLLHMLHEALDGLQAIVLGDLSHSQLAGWVAATTARPPEGSDPRRRALDLATAADDKRRDGDASGALLALISATRARPEDESLRRSLLDALDHRRANQPEETT